MNQKMTVYRYEYDLQGVARGGQIKAFSFFEAMDLLQERHGQHAQIRMVFEDQRTEKQREKK